MDIRASFARTLSYYGQIAVTRNAARTVHSTGCDRPIGRSGHRRWSRPRRTTMLNHARSEAIVEAGVLAPSADNRHMLRFQIGESSIVVRGDAAFERAPCHRRGLARISLGAVAENMTHAA